MFRLNEHEQHLLLRIARDAVRRYLDGDPPHIPETSFDILTGRHGVFVSIHKGRELRGCIGNIEPASSLLSTVAECAVAASVGDPRFMPLTRDELTQVNFEISVLSAMEPVENIDGIEIGVHGLLIRNRNAHGLLLPQVATSYGWDRKRFLHETYKKAGLNPDQTMDGLTIHRFSAFVFGELNPRAAATS